MDSLRRLRHEWDRALAVALTLTGGLALILGWFGVSGQGLTSRQIPYVVSGGLGGIFLMGVGAALWLSADLRDEWRKLDRIEAVLEQGLDGLGLGRSESGVPVLAPLEGRPSSVASDETSPPGDTAEIVPGDSPAPPAKSRSGGPRRSPRPQATTSQSGSSGNGDLRMPPNGAKRRSDPEVVS